MRLAVITAVHRRTAHLRRQLEGLARGSDRPDLHVIVALEDSAVADVVRSSGSGARVVDLAVGGGPLPVAQARNVGADAALRDGADVLVFLDVDCIPGPDAIGRYRDVAGDPEQTDALLCGPVTYLPPPGPAGYRLENLAAQIDPHPARPAPADGEVVDGTDYALFWSLSFAVTASTWDRLGGFCERYRGYGGEDTDFGQCAAAAGVPLRWIGGAHAFHQHHPVSDPPVQHLDDILRNGAIFHERWGWWPMAGWLAAFEAQGLIACGADGRPRKL